MAEVGGICFVFGWFFHFGGRVFGWFVLGFLVEFFGGLFVCLVCSCLFAF